MTLPRLGEVDTRARGGRPDARREREGDGRPRPPRERRPLASLEDAQVARVAALQREHGIAGLTTATLREAETFADDGIQDILIAYPPVGRRLQRVIDLSKRIRLRVVLDNAEIADALDDACRTARTQVGFLWEVECGTGRIGGPSPATPQRG